MQCNEFLQHTEHWMEGERDATAAAHLKSCANCSALVADLEMLQSSAPQLAEVEPPARVWISLSNQLEAEGLIREPEEAVALPAKPPRFLFGLRPALATLFLAVLVVSGAYLSFRTGETPDLAKSGAAAVDPRDGSDLVLKELALLAPLAKVKAPEIHEHNPAVKDVYRQNLQIVDNAIALCEKAVKDQPKDDAALGYLRSAYQQKADLLASMSQRGAMGD